MPERRKIATFAEVSVPYQCEEDMFDQFILGHRQVIVQNYERKFIGDFVFEVAKDLATTTLYLPDRSLLGDSQSVGDNMALYGLWARQYLRDIRARNKRLGNTKLARMEEKLLEVILLHRAMRLVSRETEPTLRVANKAIGAMIQNSLTLLLAEIRLEQWERLFNMGKLRGIEAHTWESHIAGASAATFTLLTLASRLGAEVFLPTGREDVKFWIDLFWHEQTCLHAVSIKCVTGQEEPVRAWSVDQFPVNGGGDRVTEDQRVIFLGTQRFVSSEGQPCVPVLVYVSKPEGRPIRLNQDWKRHTWPDELLARRHWQGHEDGHDLTR